MGLLACHAVSGGYGDQVVTLVEGALGRRGHVLGPLAAVDALAPAVVVAHAAPRTRPPGPDDATSPETSRLVGRDVALVVYEPGAAPDSDPLAALRTTLSVVGARVGELTVPFDTDRLPRPAATARPGPALDDVRTSRDPFGLLTLELVLDELLDRGPPSRLVRPQVEGDTDPSRDAP